MHEGKLIIGDQQLAGEDGTFDVINPATEEVMGKAPKCSPNQLDQAVSAARAAQPAWEADIEARNQAMLALSEALIKEAEHIGTILSLEQGKPIAGAIVEVHTLAGWLAAFAAMEWGPKVVFEDENQTFISYPKAKGVVGAIAPWNFPLVLGGWKICHSLKTGNTVVLKPASTTPLSTLEIGRICQEVLPAGVVNIVSGPGSLGDGICRHTGVDKVTFTGSTGVGATVGHAAMDSFKPVTLELGGNDAAIVLEDADPEETARSIYPISLQNCGQMCIAVKRIYVMEEIHDRLVAELVKCAEAEVLGHGLDPASTQGPINNKSQFNEVAELVEDAKANGAIVETGGERHGDVGYFYKPTVLSGVDNGVAIVDKEQFGPVIPVIKVKSAEEALEKANDCEFGLGGSVWSKDLERAAALAAQMNTGNAWVNAHANLNPFVPFGGIKASGLGYEHGDMGFEGYCTMQSRSIPKNADWQMKV